MDASLALRRSLPSLCLIAATLLGLARLPLIEWLPRPPSLLAISLFYWTLVRPERVPTSLLFVLGLLLDASGPTALGIQPLLLLAFHLIARQIRPTLGTLILPVMWGTFAVWFAGLALALWFALGMAQASSPPLASVAGVWLATVLFYPPLHWVFDRLLASGHKRRL